MSELKQTHTEICRDRMTSDRRRSGSLCDAADLAPVHVRFSDGFVSMSGVYLTRPLVNQCERLGLLISRCTTASPLFTSVLPLASRAYGLPPDALRAPSGEYSRIYVAMHGDRIVGTITATYARDGELEAEGHYPRALFDSSRYLVSTAYRLAVDASQSGGTRMLGKLLMRLSFSDAIAQGIRLALVSAKPEMVPFYRRAGFLQLGRGPFVHPRLRTPHVTLACSVDPSRKSLFTDIFEQVHDHFSASSLVPFLADAPT